MAQVTLQVVVQDQQVQALQQRINAIQNTQITISVNSGRGLTNFINKVTQAQQQMASLTQAQQNLQNVINQTNQAFQSGTANMQRNTKAMSQNQQAASKYSQAQQQGAQAAAAHNQALDKQGFLYKILGRSVNDFILRMTAYRAVYAGIRAITNGFTEALKTLKAVDDELVTVRKVTGFDQYQMANVESTAYEVASRYGASAADYVSGVAAFARAGYKELSGELAELAQKTQIVGDTTAETANQFLLSVDAAYKYNGSVTELSKVLDGANELDNKYATSIEKIAEGMGIVAPVAAQMHVSVDELAASIGTITAVTQRSGSETARALRALFLNIVGDTKTEIDEGVTWTTGEIEGLRDVIKVYAEDAYEAAQATGSIIDPMEAMAGLSKSLKDGILTEQELMQMVSDIGGKLRTSQLLALINNWDMYESMLEDYKNAYGSADREIENAMDSWSRKTNVLKNTWTEFVKTGLDSSMFKNALDFLTDFVKGLDSLQGVLSRIALLTAAIKLPQMIERIKKFADTVRNASFSVNLLQGSLAAIAVIWGVVSFAIEKAKQRHEELVKAYYEAGTAAREDSDKIMELNLAMETATAGSAEFNKAAQDLADTLGVKIPEGADAAITKLKELSVERLRADAAAANTAFITASEEYMAAVGGAYSTNLAYVGAGGILDVYGNSSIGRSLAGIYSGLGRRSGDSDFIDTSDIQSLEKFRAAMEQVVAVFDQYIFDTGEASAKNDVFYTEAQRYLAQTSDAYATFTEKKNDALDTRAAYEFSKATQNAFITTKADLNDLIEKFTMSAEYSGELKAKLIDLANRAYPELSGAVKDAVEETDDLKNATADLTKGLWANQQALDADADSTKRMEAAKADAEEAVRRLIPVLFDEEGALTAVGEMAFGADSNLASLVNSELNAQWAADQANYSNIIAQIAMMGDMASMTAQQLINMAAVFGLDWNDTIAHDQLSGMRRTAQLTGQSFQSVLMGWAQSYINSATNYHTNTVGSISPYVPTSSSLTGRSGSSGSSGSGRSGSSSSSSSSSSTTDTTLQAYRDRVSLLRSELALRRERGDSEEDLIEIMRQIQAALHDEAEYLRSIGGSQEDINNLSTDWWRIQNDINDLLKEDEETTEETADNLERALEAQEALNNALRQRNVHYYNAATGQWEWTANPSNVAAAQTALDDAMANLSVSDYLRFQAQTAGQTIGALGGRFTPNFDGGIKNYGSTYNIGGISISENDAKSMSVYQLMQLSKSLGIYSSAG